MESEILKEALEIAQSKKLISRMPLDDSLFEYGGTWSVAIKLVSADQQPSVYATASLKTRCYTDDCVVR